MVGEEDGLMVSRLQDRKTRVANNPTVTELYKAPTMMLQPLGKALLMQGISTTSSPYFYIQEGLFHVDYP